MRPTRGAGVALAAAVVLHQLSRITGGGWLSLAAGAALGALAAAVLLRPRLNAVEVRSTPVRTRVGDQVEVRLTVRNAGRRTSPALRLTDCTPGLAPLVVAVPALRPGAEVSALATRTATARGLAEHGTCALTSTAPFGLVRASRTCPVDGRVVVAPARALAPVLVAAGEGSGDRSRPVAGSGTEVLGLRPFREGDSTRAVHARSSARHGRPVVLERERDSGPALVLLCAGPGTGPAWEEAVATACALAEQALAAGRPPLLLADGLAAPTPPTPAALLDWHAGLDGAGRAGAATLAAAVRGAARGGALVVLAPTSSDAVAAARAAATAGARLTVLGGSA